MTSLNYQDEINTNESKIKTISKKPHKFINKKIETEIIIKQFVKKIITKEINHEDVKYNDKMYTIGYIKFKDENKLFIIDYEDKQKVINKTWHFMSDGSYISHTINNEIIKAKQLYLHNFIMNKLTFEGKGQQHTVDHINRIGLDNRKCNLRFVESQSAQNFNQKSKNRKATLPENCELNIEDLPRNIWYGKPNGKHGEFLCFEVKGLKSVLCGTIKIKSTTSKSLSLKEKLYDIMSKIEDIKKKYPELKNILLNNETEKNRELLIKEYNEIISLSSFDKEIIESNLINFKSEINNINIDIDNTEINKIIKLTEIGKKVDKLPKDCGITIDMIPKYCYFKPETDKRGCKFIIDKHPNLINKNIRQISTAESKKISINNKYKCLLELLELVNNNNLSNEELNYKIKDIKDKFSK